MEEVAVGRYTDVDAGDGGGAEAVILEPWLFHDLQIIYLVSACL